MRRFFAVSFCFGVAIFFIYGLRSNALEGGWLDAELNIRLEDEFTNVAERPMATYGGNTDCSRRSIVTRPEQKFGSEVIVPGVYAEDCMNDATFGAVGGSWLVRSGTDVAGPLTLRSNKEFIIGGPNVSTGILGDATAPVGVYINFSLNFNSQLKTEVLRDGSIKHSIVDSNEIVNLKNARNERLVAYFDTVAFSANGDYMVFDSPNYGLVRLDTKTGKIRSFAQPTSYNNGNNPGYQLAISSDGRYVVQAGSNLFRIFDLERCSGQDVQYSYLENCSFRSLEEQRVSQANYGRWPAYIRFSGDGTFRYFVAQVNGPQIVYRKYVVGINGQDSTGFHYLALGDSYASGEGAFRYKALTDMGNNRCHNSLDSYPYLIGGRSGFESYNSVACSGATVFDISQNEDDTEDYIGQYPDGIDQGSRDLPSILDQFLPGKITQHTFVEHYDPDVITISIGGNDLGFADKLKHCIIGVIPSLTCFDSEAEKRAVAAEVYGLVPELTALYQKLKHDGKRVYVLGYPKIVAPGGSCAINVRLNNDELVFADRLTTILNDAVEFAANQAGVRYVDVENILSGRRLCETNSDNTLVHGITQAKTGGTKGVYYVAQESFHPKPDAQVLYRDAILSQTANLTAEMPLPATPAQFPRLLAGDAFFNGTPSPDTEEYRPKYHNMLPPRVGRGTDWPIKLDSDFTGLPALSSVKVEIHSEPRLLGEFTTDQSGNLDETIIVPSDLEPGYHSVHVFGTNLAGVKVDYYDYLLVGVNTVDLDGDQIYDRDEGCVFGEPSGIDSDGDLTDDICQTKIEKLDTGEPTNTENASSGEDAASDPVFTGDTNGSNGEGAIGAENESVTTVDDPLAPQEISSPSQQTGVAVPLLQLGGNTLTASVLPKQAVEVLRVAVFRPEMELNPKDSGVDEGVISDFATAAYSDLSPIETAEKQQPKPWSIAIVLVLVSGGIYLGYWLFKVRNEFKQPGSEY